MTRTSQICMFNMKEKQYFSHALHVHLSFLYISQPFSFFPRREMICFVAVWTTCWNVLIYVDTQGRMFVNVFSENANFSKSVGLNVIIVRDLHNLRRKPTLNRHAKAVFPVSFVTFLSCLCQDNVISRESHILDQLLKGIFPPFPFFGR